MAKGSKYGEPSEKKKLLNDLLVELINHNTIRDVPKKSKRILGLAQSYKYGAPSENRTHWLIAMDLLVWLANYYGGHLGGVVVSKLN